MFGMTSDSHVLNHADEDINPRSQELDSKRYRDLWRALFDPVEEARSREDALECLFKCVQGASGFDNRADASPANVHLGSLVALDGHSTRIRELSPRSGRREPVDLLKRICCKVLCSACFDRNGALDLIDYEVCVPVDSSGLPTRLTFVLHLQ